jgi:hypothetical protein
MPPNAAQNAAFRKSPPMRDCVVADAVGVEPVSPQLDSGKQGKEQGIFIFGAFRIFASRYHHMIWRVSGLIPYPLEQGNSYRKQGTLKAEIVHGMLFSGSHPTCQIAAPMVRY